MFKNAIVYRFTEDFKTSFESLSELMNEHLFEPCRSQELSRFGWVKAHADTESNTFVANSSALICAQREEKLLPGAVIKQKLKERGAQIEKDQGRKVYRKEQLQMKDEIILDLLPHAFSKYRNTYALIMPIHNMIIVDAGNHKQAEELLNLLRNTLTTLPIKLPETEQAPSTSMSDWITLAYAPKGFEFHDKCVMTMPDESGAAIRITGEDLTSDDVKAHIESGYYVKSMAFEWDGTFTFTLHDDLRMTGIKPTNQLKEAINQNDSEDALQRLGADVALLSLEFSKLVPAVFEAFGGELVR